MKVLGLIFNGKFLSSFKWEKEFIKPKLLNWEDNIGIPKFKLGKWGTKGYWLIKSYSGLLLIEWVLLMRWGKLIILFFFSTILEPKLFWFTDNCG